MQSLTKIFGVPIYSMILCIEGIHHQIALHLILTSYSVMLTSTVDFYFIILIILLAFYHLVQQKLMIIQLSFLFNNLTALLEYLEQPAKW